MLREGDGSGEKRRDQRGHVAHLAPGSPCLGIAWIVPAFAGDEQALGNFQSGSRVIDRDRSRLARSELAWLYRAAVDHGGTIAQPDRHLSLPTVVVGHDREEVAMAVTHLDRFPAVRATDRNFPHDAYRETRGYDVSTLT
jgi:hypothetical protein